MAGGVYINETPPEEFFNLPLVLAYALLDEVLAELIGQGVFVCSPRGKAPALLGAKMSASKGALPWIDYAAVEAGKEARNELAHQGKLLPRQECFRLIDLIGAELVAWSVLARN